MHKKYLIVLVLALTLVIIRYKILPSNSTKLTTELTANTYALDKKEQTDFLLPARLKIPKINVDATIEQIGITPLGTMGAPSGPDSVAWFYLGPRPGEEGSAVIDGHSGWKGGRRAVFDDLYKLAEGDKIYVENEKGVATTFVVREIRTYGKDEAVPDVFSSGDGKAHLNLITCTGVWNKAEKTRSERLILFTDKE